MPIVRSYFLVDPDAALAWVKPNHTVWFFEPGQDEPSPWTNPRERPAEVVSAIVLCEQSEPCDSQLLGRATYDKDPPPDPLPPPPPPPPLLPLRHPVDPADLAAYTQHVKVSAFFSMVRSFDAELGLDP